ARLTLWYTAVVAVVLITFSSISYALLAREIRAATDESLSDTAREFAGAANRDPSNAVSGHDVQLDFRYSDRDLIIYSGSGGLVATSKVHLGAADLRSLENAVRGGVKGFATIPGGPEGDGVRIFAMPVQFVGQAYVVVVARTLAEQTDRLESAAHAVLLGIPLALLLAAAGGYLLARKALQPVAAMSKQARQIGAETLMARIPVQNERDELGLLAITLNELLERLQRAFDSQRRFMADASHELRTPVAIIQGEADVTLARAGRSAEEYRESMEVVQKASLKLTRIVQNLFLLARTDAGSYPMRKSRFYLDELVAELVRSLRNIAAARNVSLTQDSQSEMLIVADEELMHRMLLNLVDNALKFTPPGGTVNVRAWIEEDSAVIRVSDTGVGIPGDDQMRIFERFYRVNRTRQPEAAEMTSGAGLGLPIARWIAEAHHGKLALERSDSSGSIFVVVLPIDDASERSASRARA
ncbi:MAG: HAMP domain-containing sensor histidine kinase, partial [Acidobacteriota bacterium]